MKINIYVENPKNAPKIQYLGDIIRLRRFKFQIGEKGTLIGNMQKFSNWLIYPGHQHTGNLSQNQHLPFQHKMYDKNYNRPLNNYEEGRLADLRKWSEDFFS